MYPGRNTDATWGEETNKKMDGGLGMNLAGMKFEKGTKNGDSNGTSPGDNRL